MASHPYYSAELRGDVYPDLQLPVATSDAQMYVLADNALQAHQDQFAGLLQAATAAAGQEEHDSIGDSLRPKRTMRKTRARADVGLDEEALQLGDGEDGLSFSSQPLRKRKRASDASDAYGGLEQLLEAHNSYPEAQIASHHPSSALFRAPSLTGKPSTRPAIAKLFNTMEIAPENYLHLQSAAKEYMLDESHLERRDTVGQRGKGDSELVKLRLWNCVKDFLEMEGNGERFFGSQVPGDPSKGPRTMFWPAHKNGIIAALTPLMRRMVTNERQRQYAVETRKGGSVKKRRRGSDDGYCVEAVRGTTLRTLFFEINGVSFEDYTAWTSYPSENGELISRLHGLNVEAGLAEPDFYNVVAIIDYHLRVFHKDSMGMRRCDALCERGLVDRLLESGDLDHGGWYRQAHNNTLERRDAARVVLHDLFQVIALLINAQESSSSLGLTAAQPSMPSPAEPSTTGSPIRASTPGNTKSSATNTELWAPPISASNVSLQISILHNGKRSGSRVNIASDRCSGFCSVLRAALKKSGVADTIPVPSKVKALMPDGLSTISNESEWMDALYTIRGLDWMDHELKLVIEL